MSERDKMLRGELYDARDSELVDARTRARRLLRSLDNVDPADTAGHAHLLAELLGEVGENTWIEPPFRCDYGTNIHLGSRVFINFACIFLDAARITVGDDTQFGPGVHLLTSDHPRDPRERASGLESAHPITIGARCWFGGGAIVLPGIDIGSDVIVGAGSVVTRSLPSGVTAVGNPCRIVGRAG